MEGETPQEFRDRMRSIGVIKGGRTRQLEKVIVRPDDGGLDVGKKAKVTINEARDIVYKTSDNRQDAHIFGVAATTGPEGGN
jgi:hypothetical protein